MYENTSHKNKLIMLFYFSFKQDRHIVFLSWSVVVLREEWNTDRLINIQCRPLSDCSWNLDQSDLGPNCLSRPVCRKKKLKLIMVIIVFSITTFQYHLYHYQCIWYPPDNTCQKLEQSHPLVFIIKFWNKNKKYAQICRRLHSLVSKFYCDGSEKILLLSFWKHLSNETIHYIFEIIQVVC